METIGVALIGAGSIADYHLGGMAHVAGAAMRLVVGRDLERARAVAARHGVAGATDDLAAALARDDVAAAIVATPDHTHEAIAGAAIDAGRAVLLQKPMAPDSAACRRLMARAGAAGVDLQVSWMHRYFEEIDAARALIDAGRVGAVRSVRLRNATPGPDWGDWFFRRDCVGGGVVLQLGAHGLDLVGCMFGRIVSVQAHVATLRPERRLADGRSVAVENADTALAIYRLADGLLVHHEMSMIEAAGVDRFRMEIYGDEGTIWLRSERGRLASIRRGEPGWTTHDLSQAPLGARHHQDWIDGLRGRAPRRDTARD
ncbi:MAG: Gfo/Idh/MocA family oxidoreductase, partial [Methylobacteriaceae bacterium]|nr:Gfo/Idh/MocA family oxidoreductase [Methylobacteriaceae bacterium]